MRRLWTVLALCGVLLHLSACGSVVEPPECVRWEYPVHYVGICVEYR